MVARQEGMLLLPVAIVLAIMGALAYGMTRQGAMAASAVDAQYDMEVARYLAEAGLRLSKWQNEKYGCGSTRRFANAQLPGVDGSMSVDSIVLDHEKFTPVVSAKSARGSVSSATRDKMMFFDRKVRYTMTLPASALKDTYISSVYPSASYGSSTSLLATDDKEHMLMNISLSNIPARARVMKGSLSMTMAGSNSVQAGQKLAVHAVTRTWSDGSATWNAPWNTSPGGSYEPQAVASVDIAGAMGRYTWDIAPLMRRWDSGAASPFGVLFKPSGLNGATFYSINSTFLPPRLDIEYNIRCD